MLSLFSLVPDFLRAQNTGSCKPSTTGPFDKPWTVPGPHTNPAN